MKKLTLLLAAVLTFAGLVGVTGSANAAPAAYPGSVGTKIAAVNNLPPRMKHRTGRIVTVVVTAKVGNARPAGGTMRVWYYKNGHIAAVVDYPVRNGITKFRFYTKFKARWRLNFNYLPVRSSVWKHASTTRFVTTY